MLITIISSPFADFNLHSAHLTQFSFNEVGILSKVQTTENVPAETTFRLAALRQTFYCIVNDFGVFWASRDNLTPSLPRQMSAVLTARSDICADKRRPVRDVCDRGANLRPKSLKCLIVINSH